MDADQTNRNKEPEDLRQWKDDEDRDFTDAHDTRG
jgi:hypothetical protein